MSTLLFTLLITIIIISNSKCQNNCPIECVKGCYKVLYPIVQDYKCISKGRCILPAHFKEKFRVCSAFPYNKKLYNINLNILFNLNQFLDDKLQKTSWFFKKTSCFYTKFLLIIFIITSSLKPLGLYF